MVQGHALDVLLAPAYRLGAAFNFWLFLRGITAPMFLTLAGFAFAIVTTRRWDSYLHNSPEMRRRITRFCTLIFLGYMMHMPVASPFDIPSLDAVAWQQWFQVDVLQCIGFTLLVMQLSILVVRTPRRLATVAGCIAALMVICAKFTWSNWWGDHLPGFFAAYFNGIGGSLFPLFPWAAYVCTGVWLGVWFLQRPANVAARLLAVGGALLIIAGIFLQKPAMEFCGNSYFWRTSPHLFVVRIGCVSVLLAVIELLSRISWIPRGLTQSLAQQSLFIYIVHICILYGSVWNLGLRQLLGPTLNPWHTLLWVGLLLASMTLLAWARTQITILMKRRAENALARPTGTKSAPRRGAAVPLKPKTLAPLS